MKVVFSDSITTLVDDLYKYTAIERMWRVLASWGWGFFPLAGVAIWSERLNILSRKS
jgi:hypothetical protein